MVPSVFCRGKKGEEERDLSISLKPTTVGPLLSAHICALDIKSVIRFLEDFETFFLVPSGLCEIMVTLLTWLLVVCIRNVTSVTYWFMIAVVTSITKSYLVPSGFCVRS